mmetsp:Transcript_48051/g.118955  ORF Transcript_48051/g.118955 Transcript_48051/m.118955 type:complete len:256 (-) Transcript_48051:510-1277(-)
MPSPECHTAISLLTDMSGYTLISSAESFLFGAREFARAREIDSGTFSTTVSASCASRSPSMSPSISSSSSQSSSSSPATSSSATVPRPPSSSSIVISSPGGGFSGTCSTALQVSATLLAALANSLPRTPSFEVSSVDSSSASSFSSTTFPSFISSRSSCGAKSTAPLLLTKAACMTVTRLLTEPAKRKRSRGSIRIWRSVLASLKGSSRSRKSSGIARIPISLATSVTIENVGGRHLRVRLAIWRMSLAVLVQTS